VRQGRPQEAPAGRGAKYRPQPFFAPMAAGPRSKRDARRSSCGLLEGNASVSQLRLMGGQDGQDGQDGQEKLDELPLLLRSGLKFWTPIKRPEFEEELGMLPLLLRSGLKFWTLIKRSEFEIGRAMLPVA
jgi:hypothetical protein